MQNRKIYFRWGGCRPAWEGTRKTLYSLFSHRSAFPSDLRERRVCSRLSRCSTSAAASLVWFQDRMRPGRRRFVGIEYPTRCPGFAGSLTHGESAAETVTLVAQRPAASRPRHRRRLATWEASVNAGVPERLECARIGRCVSKSPHSGLAVGSSGMSTAPVGPQFRAPRSRKRDAFSIRRNA